MQRLLHRTPTLGELVGISEAALTAYGEALFHQRRWRRTGAVHNRRALVAYSVQAAALHTAARWMARDAENIPTELRRVLNAAEMEV